MNKIETQETWIQLSLFPESDGGRPPLPFQARLKIVDRIQRLRLEIEERAKELDRLQRKLQSHP